MEVSEDYVVSIALHAGVRDSSYAYSHTMQPDDIKQNKNWGASVGMQSYSAPTAILIDADGQFVAFGYDALHMYEDMLDSTDPSCHLYTRLDKQLKNCKILTQNSNISSIGGHIHPVLDIFVMLLKYLKDHCLTCLSEQMSSRVPPDLVRWVLIEPPVGSNRCTEFMREAALRAGLHSKQVVTCSEAEASAFHCLQMKKSGFNPGMKYLVMNAKSESMNLSIWDILPGRNLKAIDETTVTLGYDELEKNFIKLLQRIFGTDFITHFKEESKSSFDKLVLDLERSMAALKKNKSINIPLSWTMGQMFKEITGKNIEKVVQTVKNLDIKFWHGTLIIHDSVLKSLYKPVIESILSETQLWMGDPTLPKCETIFLIGSFGEFNVLQEAVKERFANQCHVVVCEEARLKTTNGAVLLGHSPGSIFA